MKNVSKCCIVVMLSALLLSTGCGKEAGSPNSSTSTTTTVATQNTTNSNNVQMKNNKTSMADFPIEDWKPEKINNNNDGGKSTYVNHNINGITYHTIYQSDSKTIVEGISITLNYEEEKDFSLDIGNKDLKYLLAPLNDSEKNNAIDELFAKAKSDSGTYAVKTTDYEYTFVYDENELISNFMINAM